MYRILFLVSSIFVCSNVWAQTTKESSAATPISNAEETAVVAAETETKEPLTSNQPVSLCSMISCSGNGVCIEQDGKPTCACNEGYAPDTVNGLSCISQSPAPSSSLNYYDDSQREADLAAFYSVLPNYRAERDYIRYAKLKAYKRYSGSFNDYMAGKFQGQKAGGVAMTAVGGGLTLAATMFFVVGFNADSFFGSCYYSDDYFYDDDEYCNDDEKAIFVTFGSIFSVASVTLLSIGIPKLVIGASKLRKVNTLRKTANSKSNTSSISDVSFTIIEDKNTNMFGLAGGFRF